MAEEASDSANANQQEPATKRLRSSDHDLKVIVKRTTTNGNENDKPIEKEYYFHAQVLSNLSKFIDASLSIEMKEKETMEIVFHDECPEVFELAMEFQQDAVAIRSMKPEDVVKVVEFYDRYEFTGGLELCDHVLFEYFTRNNQKRFQCFDSPEPPENLDLLVETIVLADKLMLKKSRTAGIDFLNARLNSTWIPYGRTMFIENHFEQMMPMLKHKTVTCRSLDGYSEEEFESPLFLKYVIATMRLWQATKSLRESIETIAVSGAGDQVDGRFKVDFYVPSCYESGRHGPWNGREATFSIERDDDLDWAIIGRRYSPVLDDSDNDGENVEVGDVGDDFKWVLWKCPCSANLELPPEEPWVAVDKLARGTPKIEYV